MVPTLIERDAADVGPSVIYDVVDEHVESLQFFFKLILVPDSYWILRIYRIFNSNTLLLN